MSCVIGHLSVMWTRRRRWLYCCVAIDGGGSSPRTTWLELLLILLNNRSSSSSTSWTKSGRSGEQYPHRLLRWRNASMRWLSVPVINPRWRCVCQPRHNDRPENCLKTSFAEAMVPQHSQCVLRLCTVADDAADVVRCRQRVGERDAEHFQRSAVGHVGQRRRRLDAVSTSVVVEHDFPCIGLVELQVVITCPCGQAQQLAYQHGWQVSPSTCHLHTSLLHTFRLW